jgi:CelD/BcsL family acetyltransferase involved in cellulose biosynthesis
MDSMIRLRTVDELAPVAEAWDELAARLGTSPFVRPGHVDIHRRAFGGGRLRVVLAERGGELVGVLPLHEVRGSWRSVTNWHTPENHLLVADDGALTAITWLLGHRGPARIELRFLLDEDLARLRGAAEQTAQLRLRTRIVESSPYIPVADREYTTYEQQLRSRFRSELRRRRRRLSEHGDVRVTVHDGTHDLTGLLRRAFALEASGWKRDTGTAICADSSTAAYYTDLARWAADRGWLLLAFLEVDGVAIAADISIETQQAHYLLKTGYDPSWNRYSPGQLLREEMVRRAFATGLQSYEFGGRDDDYKREWTDLTRDRHVANIHPHTALGTASLLAQDYARPVAKRLVATGTQLALRLRDA